MAIRSTFEVFVHLFNSAKEGRASKNFAHFIAYGCCDPTRYVGLTLHYRAHLKGQALVNIDYAIDLIDELLSAPVPGSMVSYGQPVCKSNCPTTIYIERS